MSTKPIHGAPKPRNVPRDMVEAAPQECRFAVGDPVVFTNDYGATFDKVVRGFAATPHGVNRFVYLDLDCWWFPVNPEALGQRVATQKDPQ